MPDIVVTGGSGFLGRAVVRRLAESGRAVMRVSRGEIAAEPGVTNLRIKHYRDLPKTMKTSVLVHAGEPGDIGAAEAAGNIHIECVQDMIEVLMSRGFARFVYLSSAVVYGDEIERPRRDDEPVSPRGIYATAKVSCEKKVLARGGVVARLSNIFGPGMARNTLIGDILAQIPGGGPLKLRDAAPVRDYLFIEDAVNAIASCATAEVEGILNIGSGVGVSAGTVARQALEIMGEAARPVVATMASERRSHLVLDISRTQKILNWQPHATLADGLGRMMKSSP